MRAIVTGAASGIGEAVALRAAEEQGDAVRLILVDRRADDLRRVEDAVRARGAGAVAVTADLADPDACKQVVSVARERLGGLDALVSNAGFFDSAPLATLTSEAFDQSIAVNARAALLLGIAARGMLADGGGVIVATASISGRHATPPLGAYSASKAALIMLIRQMAVEWGPDGIRCNTVSPGPTVTGLTATAFDAASPDGTANRVHRESFIPLRRVSEADDIAQAILFLASPAARQITGIDLTVDGGLTAALMPAAGGGNGHSRATG